MYFLLYKYESAPLYTMIERGAVYVVCSNYASLTSSPYR